ncbi:hypothetical protein KAX97_11900 [candidate division WOR-3 bacterium]|nr:hypothetical protein [candidate division WOR-3 bacterium]
MIRDRNIDNDAAIQVHKILGSAGLFLTGELFWVGTSGDAAYNKMRARVKDANLFTSLDTAFGSCVANRGDVIAVMEGHDQTVSAAAALAMDIAGVTVIFLGHGTQHAKITFDTATDADMDIDAANITLIRPKFVAGIDSLIGPIDINSTDFTIIDVEYHDADNIETLDAVIATAGATRLKIDGYKYFCGAETGDLKQSHIQLNGCDDIDLKNIDIRGDFFVGNVENVTDEVLNARLEDIYLENVNATPTPALFLDADATGSCKNVKLKIASGTTYVSNVGKMSWDDRCEGFMGDGYAGEPLGTVLGSGLEGKVDVIDGLHDVPVADAATNLYMRDVVGIKTDAAAADAVSTTESLMAYIKQAITLAIARDTAIGVIDGLHDVPTADATTNLYMRDVVGIKTDAAAAGAVSSVESLMAYVKQAITLAIARDTAIGTIDGFHDVPSANGTDDAQMRDVVGKKADIGVQAVTTNKSLMGYVKAILDILAGADGVATFPTAAAAANAVSLAEVVRYMSELQVPRIALKSTGDLTGAAATTTLFTVTGDVLCKVGASIDVAITKAATAAPTLEIGVAGNTACLCVQDAVDDTAFAVGDSWSLITAADANGAEMGDEWVLVGNDVDIVLTHTGVNLATGDMDVYCQYIPLNSSSSVVAA